MYSQILSPRFYETDALGHINNISIAGWLEVSRTGFIGSLAGSGAVEAEDWALARLEIDYLAETFFGSDVELRITEAKVGNTSLTVLSEIWQNGARSVAASATLVHFDVATKTKKRIPDALREQVEQLRSGV